MGQLKFDVLMWSALIMQEGGSYAPEAMTGHALRVAHAIQRA